MHLDERLVQRIKQTQMQRLAEGKLPTPEKLQEYYDRFRERFGPEALSALDGEALLAYMHSHGNRDSLVYWLEFKNDEEFPAIFGSIAGGGALKFGVYRGAKTGSWMSRGKQNYPKEISVNEAVSIARRHREQLLKGVELLNGLRPNGDDADYQRLQEQMDVDAPDVSRVAWGHKYFSLLFPEKLDDYHVEHFQRFHLIKLLQVPPAGDGRYLVAGRFVSASHELDMPLNHLTSVLNQLNGRPYSWWRVLVNYQGNAEFRNWETLRDGGFVAIGWANVGDLSELEHNQASKNHLRELMKQQYNSPGRSTQEVFDFAVRIATGDIVLAYERDDVLGIGRVTGPYYYEPNSPIAHRRPVDWLSIDEWATPVKEFHKTNFTVSEVKEVANLVEAERRIMGAKAIERPTSPGPPGPRILEGTPGRIQSILERKKQVILYGPPGTGKTYWAERAAYELAAISVHRQSFGTLAQEEQALIRDRYVRLTTFHPSYGYEDFLEGYRPEAVGGSMTFARRAGIFKRLCEAAHTEPEHNFYLIIDEINRGDIPRIFGELLTVLEKDKRGKSVTLPLSGQPFQVPPNVYIIGTMNAADRSIALLDTALRRRFGFIELMPDYDVLKDASVAGIPLAEWLEKLNQRIVEHVGRDARNLQIGHAYLMDGTKPVSSFDKFARMVREDIIPLLEEYCYEDYQALESILGQGLVDARSQQIRHELFDPALQDDLVQALLAPSPEITTSPQAAAAEQAELEEEDAENGDFEGDE